MGKGSRPPRLEAKAWSGPCPGSASAGALRGQSSRPRWWPPISAAHFHVANQKSETIRNLMASYIEVLMAQIQQTAACNALHAMESRLARWLLQTRDRI